jgi:hypothetical protein
MKRIILLVVTISMLSSFEVKDSHISTPTLHSSSGWDRNPGKKQAKAEERSKKKGGWTDLFDGRTKKGWHVYLNKTDGSAWQVKDGMLMLDPVKKDGKTIGGGDLVTDATYENYHFSIEWKVEAKANSGIIFNIKEDQKYEHTWHTGMEMQVLDNDGHPDGKIKTHRAGNLYDLIAGPDEPVKPVGEWNKAEIILYKGNLELRMNDQKVVSTTLWDDKWKALVAGSKFKSKKDFATFTSGHIGIQDHGDKVWFRNIKIKKLK